MKSWKKYPQEYLDKKNYLFSLLPWAAQTEYHKVESSNTSHLEAHAGFFQITYDGDFWFLCTVTFWQKFDFLIST